MHQNPYAARSSVSSLVRCFSRLIQGGVSLEERQESYMNYIDLFNLVLANDQPLKIELPDQWLWDIIEEFIYQFQSFCNFRTKLAKRTDEDIEHLRRNIKIWNVHAVLNVMHSLVDKSRIVEQLEASKKGGQTSDVDGTLSCNSPLLLQLPSILAMTSSVKPISTRCSAISV